MLKKYVWYPIPLFVAGAIRFFRKSVQVLWIAFFELNERKMGKFCVVKFSYIIQSNIYKDNF